MSDEWGMAFRTDGPPDLTLLSVSPPVSLADFCACGHHRMTHYCRAGNCMVGEVNADGYRAFVGADGCRQFRVRQEPLEVASATT